MNAALLGAIAMASLVAALFFLRFWRDTKDRLFLFFAISFLVEGLNRFALAMVSDPNEDQPFFYVVRFLSFLLIVAAILDKNLSKKTL
jgi:4-hydroxybenzoate polyprenyltransferase